MQGSIDMSQSVEARLRALESRVGERAVLAAPTPAAASAAPGPVPPAAPVAASAPTPRPGKDAWERFAALLPIVNGIVLALVGYWLTGAVNEGFKRQELHLANAREMRDLLRTLQGADTTLDVAQSSAFTLAAFGAPAVPPLIGALAAGGDTRAPAAEAALRVVGLTDPVAVCQPILQVLENRTGRFSWLTHQSALRLVADLQCRDPEGVLRRYAPLVADVKTPDGLLPLQDAMARFPTVDRIALEELRLEFDRAQRFAAGRR